MTLRLAPLLCLLVVGLAGAREPYPLHHPETLRRFEALNRALNGQEEPLELRQVEAHPYLSGADTLINFYDRQRIAPEPLDLPYAALPLLRLLDGTRALPDILQTLARDPARDVRFRGWLQALDEGLFLENRRFRERLVALVREFEASPVREPICAGSVYSRDPDEVRAWTARRLNAPPRPDPAPRITGVIAPHIDYARGAPTYAKAYACLKGQRNVARVVLLGTAHMPAYRPFALTRKAYETPLGRCPTDTAFVERLLARYPHPAFEDEFLHRGEHSIELQLPYLQALFGPEAPIVPVLCGSLHAFIESGDDPMGDAAIRDFRDALRAAVAASPGRTLLIAASDLAHAGRQFGDPFLMTDEVLRQVEADDRRMLAPVVQGDADGFLRDLVRDRDARRICGSAPIYTLLKVLEPGPGTLLEYRQCTDSARTCTVTIPAIIYGDR
jgi:AmmeMemoRadiSam system protein B